MDDGPAKRAWRTTLCGVESIVAACTRGQAIAVTVRSALEVYDRRHVDWRKARARRAPEYDDWASLDATGVCWGEEYLKGCKS